MCLFGVVVITVSDEMSAILVELFMKYVIMKFGICPLIIVDDGRLFKELFNSLKLYMLKPIY